MNRKFYPWFQNLALLAAGLIFVAMPVPAQNDPNPNSPIPILIPAPNSMYALALPARAKELRGLPATTKDPSVPLDLNARTVLFVRNVQLMKGEGSNAFRVYAADAFRRLYRFPVLNLQPVDERNGTYAITVELRDELQVSDVAPSGELLVSVAWRGLESNKLLLTVGEKGAATPSQKPALSAEASYVPEAQISNVGYIYSGDRNRFLQQAAFGPSPALDLRVRRIGLRGWLAEQFDMPYPSAGNPYPNFPLRPTTLPVDCNGQIDNGVPDSDPFCYPNHYTMYPVQNWFYKEALYGDAQLRHRVAWALGQIWVISGVDIQQSSHMVAYHKVLSRNAFGNWRTLMQEMTLNPGMGDYLDMREVFTF